MPAFRRPSSKAEAATQRRRTSVQQDDAALAGMGIKQELNRNFSFLSMLGLAFAILNTWTAAGASMSLALPSGGPSSVTWGLSWINTAGWVALSATAGLLGSTLILGIISLADPSYEAERWHQFLIYIAFNAIAFLINAYLTRLLPLVTQSALYWSIAGWLIIMITILACSSPNYQSGHFVYGEFINETGWPDGFSWLLGLLQGSFSLTAFDACAHMIEELGDATREGPRIMIACVLIGVVTGFLYLSVLLFCAKDIDTVISSASGPMLEIFYQATNNKAGAICLLMFPLVCLTFAGISIMTTSSRMVYAFARDGGLPASKWLAKVNTRLVVPLNALIFTGVLVIIFGCIFLGSTSAYNAIVSASVVALGITYAIPPAINCLRGRKMLPASRPFVLPSALGWTCNLVGIAYTLLTTVLFMFPPLKEVTGSNMNYCVAAFAIVFIVSIIQWFVDGRKNYTGPQLDIDALKKGEIVGMAPTESNAGPQSENDVDDAKQKRVL